MSSCQNALYPYSPSIDRRSYLSVHRRTERSFVLRGCLAPGSRNDLRIGAIHSWLWELLEGRRSGRRLSSSARQSGPTWTYSIQHFLTSLLLGPGQHAFTVRRRSTPTLRDVAAFASTHLSRRVDRLLGGGTFVRGISDLRSVQDVRHTQLISISDRRAWLAGESYDVFAERCHAMSRPSRRRVSHVLEHVPAARGYTEGS